MSVREERADPWYWFEQAAYYQGLAEMTGNRTHGRTALSLENRAEALVTTRLAPGSR
jgi:hypothetical protein